MNITDKAIFLHGINTMSFSIGNFDFTKQWMNLVVQNAGGFVGNIERKDPLSSGLFSIIQSSFPTSDYHPSLEFLRKLQNLDNSTNNTLVKTLISLAQTVIGDEQVPKLESSFQNANLFIDRVRGLFIAKSGSWIVREEAGTVSLCQNDEPCITSEAHPEDEITYQLEKGPVGMIISHAENGEVAYVIPMQNIKPTAISLSLRTVIIYGLNGVPSLVATIPSKAAIIQKISKSAKTTILEIDSNNNCRTTELEITLGSSRVSSSSSEPRP